ncbi:hypothetical protein [Mesorhizobium sp. STM 4661]|uniref:hypothetical protein n=1 Tax=Mesorhizobium sp. STM 4661 TaxID=1297570 RepID=UPI0002BF09C4|nr:hypothetical protein [Mesorhizobium sp. STM 4661]CCV15791.1 conserved membrane hypothetical protein [Mesorhizobium sp. STM 4661]
MTLIQKLAIAYAFLFFGVVAIGYIPAFNDANGNLFGLFSLQWYDDLLHAFSGVWARAAAFISRHQAVFYFKLLGSIYLFDGLLGLITGSGCLDAGIFINGFRSLNDVEFPARFFANLPHLVIGGFAVYVGFGLSKRVHDHFATA